MPIETAMQKDVFTVKPEWLLQDAVKLLRERKVRMAPVVDDNGHLVGTIGIRCIIEELLPVSARMQDGLGSLEFVHEAGGIVAENFQKVKLKPVSDIMKTDLAVAHPDMGILEGIRLVLESGSPLPVVENGTKKLIGILSEQSIIENYGHYVTE